MAPGEQSHAIWRCQRSRAQLRILPALRRAAHATGEHEERSDCASLVRQLQTEGRTLSFTPSLGKESLEYWPSKEGALHSLWNPTAEAPLRGLNNSTVNSPEILLQVSSSLRAVGKEGDEDEVTW